MNWHLIAILSLLLLLGYCAADGMPMPSVDYTQEVFLPEQKAVIFWDGSQEQLVIESKITVEDIASVAWLIPIESSSKPIVEAADEQIFFDLAELFAPAPKDMAYSNILGLPTATGSREGVEVVEQLKVDIYDITILRATDADALIKWLNSNGYSFPAAFPNLLEEYVKNGSIYFIANKINLQNKYPGVQPTKQDFECAQEWEGIVREDYWQRSPAEIEERIKYNQGPRTSPACPASVNADAVAALVVLRLGIATPLKITFTPSKPFYPMLLSSLNVGSGDAKLYFVSSKPYKDDSGLFAVKNMKTLPQGYLSDYGIEGDYVTLLEWEGNYFTLEKDAEFAETAFDPRLDPDHVPPEQILFGALLTVLMFLVVFIILAIPFVLIPFLLGFTIAYIFEEMKKKGFFAQSNRLIGWLSTVVLVLIGPVILIVLFILPDLLFSGNLSGDMLPLLFIFLPYYVSMLFGFLFRKSGHKLRYLAGAALAFLLILAIALLLVMPLAMTFD